MPHLWKLILATFAISAPAYAQLDTYLCKEDLGAGFSRNTGQWRHANFHPNSTYLIAPASVVDSIRYPGAVLSIRRMGRELPSYVCYTKAADEWWCGGELGQFKFDRRTLRFLATYLGGYTEPTSSEHDTPFIAAGSCTPFTLR